MCPISDVGPSVGEGGRFYSSKRGIIHSHLRPHPKKNLWEGRKEGAIHRSQGGEGSPIDISPREHGDDLFAGTGFFRADHVSESGRA